MIHPFLIQPAPVPSIVPTSVALVGAPLHGRVRALEVGYNPPDPPESRYPGPPLSTSLIATVVVSWGALPVEFLTYADVGFIVGTRLDEFADMLILLPSDLEFHGQLWVSSWVTGDPGLFWVGGRVWLA